jgi:hypothetical protein
MTVNSSATGNRLVGVTLGPNRRPYQCGVRLSFSDWMWLHATHGADEIDGSYLNGYGEAFRRGRRAQNHQATADHDHDRDR